MLSKEQIAVYTTLKTVKLMRKRLGIGASIEFMDAYIAAVDRRIPELGAIVSESITEKAIESLYLNGRG